MKFYYSGWHCACPVFYTQGQLCDFLHLQIFVLLFYLTAQRCLPVSILDLHMDYYFDAVGQAPKQIDPFHCMLKGLYLLHPITASNS